MLAHLAAGTLADHAGNVDLGAGLREREERRTEPRLRLRAEHAAAERVDGALQVGERHAFVDVQALDLMELIHTPRIDFLVAIATARHCDSYRRPLLLHDPDLRRRRVRAEEPVLLRQEVRILHVARRVVRREVQRFVVVVVGLDLRAFGNGEAHLPQDGEHLVHRHRDGMEPAERLSSARQSRVELPFDGLRARDPLPRGLKRLGNELPYLRTTGSELRTLVGSDLPDALHDPRQRRLATKILDAQFVDLRFVRA